MSNFALVTCLEEVKEQVPVVEVKAPKEGLIRRILNRVVSLFKKNTTENAEESEKVEGIKAEVKRIELYENTVLFPIKILYDTKGAEKKSARISGFIDRFVAENDIKTCILSCELEKSAVSGWGANTAFSGYFLYRALLVNLLEEICLKNSIKISDLDITIIHGDSDHDLFTVLRLLSPIVKYITVMTSRRDDLQAETNDIYAETGLSISLTSDNKAALREACVVLNLGGPDEVRNLKINPKSLIINLNASALVNFNNGNMLINGMEISLPVRVLQKLDRDIVRNFSKLVLAEGILCHKLGLEEKVKKQGYDGETVKCISNEFKKDGYRITGCRGRHNRITLEDIGLCI